jgi:hypothetical protein
MISPAPGEPAMASGGAELLGLAVREISVTGSRIHDLGVRITPKLPEI